jgi:hypothetical protein
MRRLLILALLVVACSPTAEPASPPSTDAPATTAPAPSATTTSAPTGSSLADQIVPVGSALYDPTQLPEPGPAPVALTVEGVDIDRAPIVPVGVESSGEMEIPGAREIGWYRFGPTPRDEGSAVLAAHIAFNGRRGVFRRLTDVQVGVLIRVEYEDGTSTTHVVTEMAQYPKSDLPLDRVFSKNGTPTLTLITCGGWFNSSLRSYDDNVVVYATPLDG